MSRILLPSDNTDPAFLELPWRLYSYAGIQVGSTLSQDYREGVTDSAKSRIFRVSDDIAVYGNRNLLLYVQLSTLKILESFTLWNVPHHLAEMNEFSSNRFFSSAYFRNLPFPELETMAKEFLEWVSEFSPIEYIQVVRPSSTELNALSIQLGFRHSIPLAMREYMQTERWPTFSTADSLRLRSPRTALHKTEQLIIYRYKPSFSSSLWAHQQLCIEENEISKQNANLMKILGIKKFSSNLPETLNVLEDYEERYGTSFFEQLKKVK